MLSHLRELEAESIHVIREVAAEFARPVLLYSIGKDSQVLLHLARKAFHPAPVPFPLLHVDTTWKFREMYAFRDRIVRELGLRLLVHRNQRALDEGINPFDHSSQKYTFALKTQALLEALANGGYDAAFGGARRDEIAPGGGVGVGVRRTRLWSDDRAVTEVEGVGADRRIVVVAREGGVRGHQQARHAGRW